MQFALGILACTSVLSLAANQGDVCTFEDGVLGTCEDARFCRRSGGIIWRNNAVKYCHTPFRRNTRVCCRRVFAIANTMCKYWTTYWRDNDGNCVYLKPLIVGGINAGVGQFPEMAIVGEKKGRRKEWICGGTILSPHFILTAAHCVYKKSEYLVKVGEHDIFTPDEGDVARIIGAVPNGLFKEFDLHFERRHKGPIQQIVNVFRVIIYPGYDGRYNDIALLQLNQPILFTKRALPACLSSNRHENFLNMKLTVAGWGITHSGNKRLSSILQKVDVPIIPPTECSHQLDVFLIPKGLRNSQMCAGEKGKSFCYGDSGGPLVTQVRETPSSLLCEHTVAGIVSFSPGCNGLNVYTRVSSYIDWITAYIAPKLVPNIKF